MRQMMKRHLEAAGLPRLFSPHSFRAAVVTYPRNQNIPLEDVQYLAGLLKLKAGSTERLIEQAAQRWHYRVRRRGATTIIFDENR